MVRGRGRGTNSLTDVLLKRLSSRLVTRARCRTSYVAPKVIVSQS